MKYFTTTDVGRVRDNNEDSYLNFSSDNFNLFIVCDGMGGHNAGEVASKMASEIVSDEIIKSFDPNEIFDTIANSVRVAHNKILEKSQNDYNCRGMGTTLVLALIYNDTLYYANVGDSRIYLYHNQELKQITKDHSFVQELLDTGIITEEEAKFYPKNRITSALGTSIEYKIDIDRLKLNKSDYLLLTTDGLTDMIDDSDILDVLKNEYEVNESCEMLQYMANSTGGKDNITITLVEIEWGQYEWWIIK